MRREVIARERAQHGRRALAVLPVHYPKELLTAMDVLAVELWGPPGPPRGPAAGRLQAYVCPIARNALAFLQAGGAEAVDGVLVPHTCDALQGLGSLLLDFGGAARPCLTFVHPKGEDRESARTFLRAELPALAEALAAVTGRPLDLDRLRWAIALHQRIDLLRHRLLAERARFPGDDEALYALLRRGEWLWPEDHRRELEEAVRTLAPAPVQTGIPIAVTGYVPEPAGFLRAVGEAGMYLAADDYAAVGRRIVPAELPERSDPWEALVDRYFAAPPCPTRSASRPRRMRHLDQLVGAGHAEGVVAHLVQFCEPELFDVPVLRRHCAARGLPLLELESELPASLPAQLVTRLEAFGELLAAKRRRA